MRKCHRTTGKLLFGLLVFTALTRPVVLIEPPQSLPYPVCRMTDVP
jgi:hypothetical protein